MEEVGEASPENGALACVYETKRNHLQGFRKGSDLTGWICVTTIHLTADWSEAGTVLEDVGGAHYRTPSVR